MSQLNPYQRYLASRKQNFDAKAVIEARKSAPVTQQPAKIEPTIEEKIKEKIPEVEIEVKEPADEKIEITEDTVDDQPAETEFTPRKRNKR